MGEAAARGLGGELAVNPLKETQYRLTLARGYVEEAEQLARNSLFRASVSSAQLAVENAAKAVIALFRPVAKTHHLNDLLISLIEEQKLDDETSLKVEHLALCTSRLGFREHILTDYGDELTLTSPWEIYTKERAESGLAIAKAALALAEEVVAQADAKPKGDREN
jgi:HEPN domain-containing protein